MGLVSAIGAGLGLAGSVIGSNNNRKAARRAARASEQGTAQSLAFQRESRDMGLQRLDPFVNRGNAAGNAINALLGLGGSQEMGGPATMQMPNAMMQFGGGVSPAVAYGTGDGMTGPMGGFQPDATGLMPQDAPITATTAPMAAPQGQTAQQAAQNAFDVFRNSTGYQFRVNEAQDALNSGFAGSGLLQSGAALRELDDLRQNMASAEFGNYMGYLGQQQSVGAGTASAAAGVGQNFANNAGSLVMNNANNQANAAIYRAQNNPLAAGLGMIGGGLLGYGNR